MIFEDEDVTIAAWDLGSLVEAIAPLLVLHETIGPDGRSVVRYTLTADEAGPTYVELSETQARLFHEHSQLP